MNRPNWIGQILGERYRIDEIIGQGGMSTVFKAYDPNLKRVVAIKMIHSHLADDPMFLIRFEEEATAVAQLRHPNIVQVYDFNHDGDLYYMVQEFIPGETLQEHLRRLNKTGRRLSPTDAVRYTRNICDAAGYAHRRGMIHRDIKPANIMLAVQDQAILMDFGIVKITGGERHTATGAVVGTALYLSPELIRGEAADPRSDIYSLGVTLFEMVNGRPPFESDSAMSLMMMHINDPLPDLRFLRPEVPEGLIAVIEKSLEKDRERRFTSMQEMGAALSDLLLPDVADKVDMKTEIEAPTPAGAASTVGDISVKMPALESPQRSQDDASLPAPAFERGGTIQDRPAQSPRSVPASAGESQEAAAIPGYSDAHQVNVSKAADVSALGKKGISPVVWAAGAVVLLLIVAGVVFTLSRGSGGEDMGSPVAAAPATQTRSLAVLSNADETSSPTPSQTATVTVTPSPSLTPTATQTPTPTLSPTPTIPVGIPYSRINGIATDNQDRYVVDYETFEFTEQLPGQHVHFFFNTVPPEEAGNPGSGPWYLWGGPRPFNRYGLGERPRFATQMCILVANPDHSVQLNSGNCFFLPDVPVVTAVMQLDCLSGPGPSYPAVTPLTPAQPALVLGISPDESWWNVANPLDTTQNCWLPQNLTLFNGDISTLPMVPAPPLPTGAVLPNLSVEILSISVDEQSRYVVEYVTHGYTEQLPGTHMHFFFNTISPDQVGASGTGIRLMHGGPTPFTGYTTNDRPAAATQMCVLVANPDHSVVLDSGNCFDLPDYP